MSKVSFFIVFNDYIGLVNINFNQNKHIFIWLLTLTIMTFFMILIGGLTRLTESGLSMVDWRPFMGIIPPLNAKNWIEAFKSYQNSPEFLIVNKNMALEEFKFIFWWEWFHRFFARCIGIVFIFPMFYFIFRKKLNVTLFYNLCILFLFGLFQSIVGWWMVKSGLHDNPYVSPYRLAFHLTNAVIILCILFWLTLNSLNNFSIKFFPENKIEIVIFFTIIFIIITIISGAFMAGSNAGKSFNTFPLMNGKLIPDDYFLFNNFFKNIFENTISINFNHRWIASLSFLIVIFLAIYIKYICKIKDKNLEIFLIIFFVIIQFILGILTLLTNVKIHFASMHQVNSMLLLGSLIYTYYSLKKERII